MLLLSAGFRIFFLLGGTFACVAVGGWLLLLKGLTWPGAPTNPLLWHVHELLVGFVGAAAAGFLLTAIPAWTNHRPLRGGRLGCLAGCWLAGRVALAFGAGWPKELIATLDLLFPLLLAIYVLRTLLVAGNQRNYIVGGIVALLPISNFVYHLGELNLWPGAQQVVYLLPHFVALLVVVIGGRIIPSFTVNWLRLRHGARQDQRLPISRVWVERLVLPLTIGSGLAVGFVPEYPGVGLLALATALIHGIRLAGWRGQQTFSEPLLAVLHVGYGWLVLAYTLLATHALTGLVPSSAATHALTVGGLGTMILAVMSRVALGHTGRPLRAARLTVLAYVLINFAALARVLAPLSDSHYTALLNLAALGWIVAWMLFLWVYWPVLCGSRVTRVGQPPTAPTCVKPS